MHEKRLVVNCFIPRVFDVGESKCKDRFLQFLGVSHLVDSEQCSSAQKGKSVWHVLGCKEDHAFLGSHNLRLWSDWHDVHVATWGGL